jgi:mRNA-degrading endonuclease RelE of RelBE toxin-antitoxin system
MESLNYSLYFSEIAENDIEKALYFYENINESVVNHFKKQLNQVLEAISINPFYQIKYKNIRALPFKSMPYIVLFEVYENEKMVYIYSIFNTYQNPDKYPNL